MYTEKDLSVVVPSYNNLEYFKLLYESVRVASKDVEIIMISDGSTDGTAEYMQDLVLVDENSKLHVAEERTGHTILYDYGFEMSDRDIVGILHADMVVHKDFFKNILKRLDDRHTIVCGTCVEPPLHPAGLEKYIFDAGMYPSDFDMGKFNSFCEEVMIDATQKSIFAPWFVNREAYFALTGGHDERFAPYGYEDCDIFTRMQLAGFNFAQSRDSLVYHFTQRGHKWTKGVGVENDDYRFQMNHTRREYIRKFGTMPQFDELHYPRPAKLYTMSLVLPHDNVSILRELEPFFSYIHCNLENPDTVRYIEAEDEVSAYDISHKFKGLDDDPTTDIIVTFDSDSLHRGEWEVLCQLPLILEHQLDSVGEYTLYTINVKVKDLQYAVATAME